MTADNPGYDDTPVLPHVEYRVHDTERPHPRAVSPGDANFSSPPGDATVLLGERDSNGWEHEDGRPSEWSFDDGVLRVEPGTGDVRTSESFGDAQLHLEWVTPPERDGEGQGMGNSGVFLLDRYEVQVLDNYENPTYADGYAGAIYGQTPPLVNACLPPGTWQSYDIVVASPRFDGDELATPGTVTVFHNGVLVHDRTELLGPTSHRTKPVHEPHPPTAPLRLQDHGDRVGFRNIWYRPRELSE